MSEKSFDEKMAELLKKQEQLKAREKALRKKHSEDERKRRTRRLIELGGIIESILERATVDEDKIKLLRFLEKQERNGKYFTRAMNEPSENEKIQ